MSAWRHGAAAFVMLTAWLWMIPLWFVWLMLLTLKYTKESEAVRDWIFSVDDRLVKWRDAA